MVNGVRKWNYKTQSTSLLLIRNNLNQLKIIIGHHTKLVGSKKYTESSAGDLASYGRVWHRKSSIQRIFLPFFLPPIFDTLEGQGILRNRISTI